jgi:hypothetical protein
MLPKIEPLGFMVHLTFDHLRMRAVRPRKHGPRVERAQQSDDVCSRVGMRPCDGEQTGLQFNEFGIVENRDVVRNADRASDLRQFACESPNLAQNYELRPANAATRWPSLTPLATSSCEMRVDRINPR